MDPELQEELDWLNEYSPLLVYNRDGGERDEGRGIRYTRMDADIYNFVESVCQHLSRFLYLLHDLTTDYLAYHGINKTSAEHLGYTREDAVLNNVKTDWNIMDEVREDNMLRYLDNVRQLSDCLPELEKNMYGIDVPMATYYIYTHYGANQIEEALYRTSAYFRQIAIDMIESMGG